MAPDIPQVQQLGGVHTKDNCIGVVADGDRAPQPLKYSHCDGYLAGIPMDYIRGEPLRGVVVPQGGSGGRARIYPSIVVDQGPLPTGKCRLPGACLKSLNKTASSTSWYRSTRTGATDMRVCGIRT